MMAWWTLWLACGGKDDEGEAPLPPLVEPACDAGDAAFVERAFLLVLGRRPHGHAELARFVDAVEAHGREVVVRALTRSPEYTERWRDFLQDALGVARVGDRADPLCYGEPLLPADDGELARWLAEQTFEASYMEPFNMSDVLVSAIRADDLTGPWRLHLYARMRLPQSGANVGPDALEEQARKNFGDSFTNVWLNRDMTCMPCHNSQLAATDNADPALDRHWPTDGLVERALFGLSSGTDEARAFQVFRTRDLLSVDGSGLSPFGMSPVCGVLTPRDAVPAEDPLGDAGFFITDVGGGGSVYDVEEALRTGVQAIVPGGLAVSEDGTVAGDQAFAWMLAQNIVGQVWREGMGERLTIANYFPRNPAQRDRLQRLTERFVANGYSLRELLGAVATDPLFNEAAPGTCDGPTYGFVAVVNPWSFNEEDPARRGNSAGDLVHRLRGRTLMRAAHDALGWPAPERYPGEGTPVQATLAAIGAYQRESQPGFAGIDAQGMLAWSEYVATCAQPTAVTGAGDGCSATPSVPTCAGCGCEAEVCAADPYCCIASWDEACVAACEATAAGCGLEGGAPGGESTDVIDALIARGVGTGATLQDAIEGLRDRLVLRGEVLPDEVPLLEGLVGPLTAPLTADLEDELRLVCGATLVSAPFMMVMDAGPAGAAPGLALPDEADCAAAQQWFAAEGVAITCGGAR